MLQAPGLGAQFVDVERSAYRLFLPDLLIPSGMKPMYNNDRQSSSLSLICVSS